MLLGQAWSWLDYERTREQRARTIINALHTYLERESLYPDRLDELVEAGLLERIPEPTIGLPLERVDGFDYASYGTSYLLDFSAPRWVQCHYTPARSRDLDEEIAPSCGRGGLRNLGPPPTPPDVVHAERSARRQRMYARALRATVGRTYLAFAPTASSPRPSAADWPALARLHATCA